MLAPSAIRPSTGSRTAVSHKAERLFYVYWRGWRDGAGGKTYEALAETAEERKEYEAGYDEGLAIAHGEGKKERRRRGLVIRMLRIA